MPASGAGEGDHKIPFGSGALAKMYDFTGQVIVITGGTGILGAEVVRALAECGATLAVLVRDPARGKSVLEKLGNRANQAALFTADVLDRSSLQSACDQILARYKKIDCLINAAGGNKPKATTNPELKFFDLPEEALREVFDLNIIGTILPCQVFGKVMADQKAGVILNFSSMSAIRPLTRIPAYSAAKAGVNSFTEWLAVHMAQEYSPRIRVNALAPGFFLTNQNRFLLLDRGTGEPTARGKAIVTHTPMNRFGDPADLLGTILWLLSPASAFVTGTVVAVDGGFAAFSGV
jgi:NAD(P)-dependent dehydrogenase (short-subunit alcohol dehydrogenase family)